MRCSQCHKVYVHILPISHNCNISLICKNCVKKQQECRSIYYNKTFSKDNNLTLIQSKRLSEDFSRPDFIPKYKNLRKKGKCTTKRKQSIEMSQYCTTSTNKNARSSRNTCAEFENTSTVRKIVQNKWKVSDDSNVSCEKQFSLNNDEQNNSDVCVLEINDIEPTSNSLRQKFNYKSFFVHPSSRRKHNFSSNTKIEVNSLNTGNKFNNKFLLQSNYKQHCTSLERFRIESSVQTKLHKNPVGYWILKDSNSQIKETNLLPHLNENNKTEETISVKNKNSLTDIKPTESDACSKKTIKMLEETETQFLGSVNYKEYKKSEEFDFEEQIFPRFLGQYGNKESQKIQKTSSITSLISANAWYSLFSPLCNDFFTSNVQQSQKFGAVKKFAQISGSGDCSILFHEITCAKNYNQEVVKCPITLCNRYTSTSEFVNHFQCYHKGIPVERIQPGKHKSIFLDLKVNRKGLCKCHFLLLICDKVCHLGNGKFQNYLPITLMSTKINLCDLLYFETNDHLRSIANDCNQDLFIVWVSGLVPSNMKLYYCITVWPRYSQLPMCHLTRSGILNSVKEEHNVKDLYRNGQAIVLSEMQFDQLTNNGENMIEVQIMVT